MSEFDGLSHDGVAMQSGGGAEGHAATQMGASAGTLLRQAREAAGLHIAALAVALKVPVKKLEALETDRFDLLPDAVFVRALAASVCRTLKVDASEVLALLPQTGKPRLDHQQTAINTPFRAPGDGPGPSVWTHISRPTVMIVLLLVVSALVLIFLPDFQQQGASSPAMESGAAGSVPVNSTSAQAGVAMATVELLESAKPVRSDTPVAPPVIATVSPTAALPAGLSPSVTPVPTSASPIVKAAEVPVTEPVQASATGIIVFKAKSESWVEVKDARGVVVLRRTLAAGEAAGASGTLPLVAVVGRADATQVQIRGKAFDLNAVSKDNVARFEVK